MLNIRGEFDRLAMASNQLSTQELFAKEFGPQFQRVSTNPATKFVQFDPSSSNVKVRALLLIDTATKTGHLYACQLPDAPGGYALVRLDANGQPMRDANGQLDKLCEITSASESGSVYNSGIRNIEPGTPVGLVEADAAGASANVLLRGRQL
jgi:hypothetical protein